MPLLRKASTWIRATRRVAKGAPGGAGGYSYGGGPAFSDAYRSRRGPSASELVEAYKSLIYFLMRTNSMATASVPLRLYVTTGDKQDRAKCATKSVPRARKAWIKASPHLSKMVAGAAEIEEVTEHPILQALHDQNPFMDFHQWLIYTVEQMDLIGSAYTLPEFGSVGRAKVPTGHWVLPAHLVYPIPTGVSLVPKGYQYFSTLYLPDELIRFRFLGHRNPYMDGMSPARAAISYARLEDEFVAVQDAVLSNGPRPSVIVSPKDIAGVIGKPERERFRNDFAAVGRGGRQGGAIFADGAIDVKPITWSPADIGAKVLSEYDVERAANCFGVPTPFYSGETNLANMEAARSLHAELAVEPRCRNIANTLTRFYRSLDKDGRLGWDRLFFAFDPASREDEEKKAKIVDMGLKNGSLTINQANADNGLPDVPWGDEPWLPQTLIQPSAKAEAAERASALTARLPIPGQQAEPTEVESTEPDGEGKKRLPFAGMAKMAPDRGTDFGGEKGDDLRAELIKWFQRQHEEVIGAVPDIGAPLPDRFPSLADYDDPMASAMVPILSTYWDRGGKTTNARLGLDPEDWNVRRPELAGKIRDAAFAFCQSTNQSTSKRLDVALEELRGALTDGGGTLPSLTKKVNEIFTGLTKSHAEMIAASESSRALHAAQVEASKESGVVAGFELLLSSDACPLCRAIYDSCPRVRVGDAFAVIGEHPTYATIQHPPLHPACACGLADVIIPSMGGPIDPTFYETLHQPQEALQEGRKPQARVKPGGAPVAPVKPPQPQPVAPIEPPKPKPEPEVHGATPELRDAMRRQIAANGGQRIKDGPIAERIKAYEVGDAKVRAIVEVGEQSAAELKRLQKLRLVIKSHLDTLDSEVDAVYAQYPRQSTRDALHPEAKAKIDAIEVKRNVARESIRNSEAETAAIHESNRRRIRDLIAVQHGAAFTHDDVPKGYAFGKTKFSKLGTENQNKVRQAQDWLSTVTSKDVADRVHVQMGEKKDHRAFHAAGLQLITIARDEEVRTVVHEYGHALENQLGVMAKAKEFLSHRVGSEKPVSMAQFGMRGEYGRKDKFDEAFPLADAYYIGKDYGGRSTEIVSMGVEKLFKDPVMFAKYDPEYCKFILGILDGGLR